MTTDISPIGQSVEDARHARAARSGEYREERERRAPYEAIARRVLLLRMERGLSQGQLAERAGTGHSQIGRVESGQYATSVETLKRIAAALDADLEITLVPRSGGVGTVGVAS